MRGRKRAHRVGCNPHPYPIVFRAGAMQNRPHRPPHHEL